MAEQSIGMMQGAFFVPKSDLLQWVNGCLGLQVVRVQQLGTGAIYCQLIDAMFPGKVAMQRVNWSARNEWEFIPNYKILQQAFAKCKVQKHVDIEKLAKCKYQDNLQFIQWLKRYYDLNNKNTAPYDAAAVRKHMQPDFSFVALRFPSIKHNALHRDRESVVSLRKSPAAKARPQLNNRSLTLTKDSSYYLAKLHLIGSIVRGEGKESTKLDRIQEVVEEVEEKRERPKKGKLKTIQSQSKL